MPAYNAGRTLRMTYEELPKDAVSMVILVDDGSTDATLEIARQLGLEIFVHNRNYGYGANQKTCYAEALRAGADVVVMVHPDYQYDPRLVPQIIEPILRGEADVVLGSRLKTGSALRQGMPWWKYVSNRFLTALENRAFRLRLSEFHTGYRAFRREVLERVNFVLNSDGFVFDQEIIAQVVAARFRIARSRSRRAIFPRRRRRASAARPGGAPPPPPSARPPPPTAGPPGAPAASTPSGAATRASRRRSASRPAGALDDPPPLDDHRASLGRPPRRGARAPPAGHLPWRWAPGPRYKETRHGGARGDEASGHDPRDPRPRPRGRLLCGRPADGRVEARPHRPRARRQVPRAAGDARDDAVGLARPQGAAQARRQLRRHGRGRDDDARAQQDPARDDDGGDRRPPQSEPGGRAPLPHRADLRERRRARRRDGDPDPQDHSQGVRRELQPPRQGVPDDRRARLRDARRLREVLLPRLGQASGGVQARHRRRPPAVPGDAGRRHRPQGPLAAQGRRDRSDGAGVDAPALEERLEHGHQRAAGGHDDLHPDLPQGRPRLDGRFPLPPGQWRGQPHRARVRLPRDRDAAHRAQGPEARLAARGDEDALDHAGLRRGPQPGDGERRPRDRRLPREPEDGAADPLRGLLARLDGGRLPRDAGGGRAQGCPLHDPEVDLRQAVVGCAPRCWSCSRPSRPGRAARSPS